MLSSDTLIKIGEIPYRGITVSIYKDVASHYTLDLKAVWQIRNPKSIYQGYMYMSDSGEMTYPEGAVIPTQTSEDKELLPKAILISDHLYNITKFTREEFLNGLIDYLDTEYKKRNPVDLLRDININKILGENEDGE